MYITHDFILIYCESINKSNSEGELNVVDVTGRRRQSLLQVKKEAKATGYKDLERVILQDKKLVLDAILDDQLPGARKIVINFCHSRVRQVHLSTVLHSISS